MLLVANFAESWYHSGLRVALVVVAVMVVFESGIISGVTKDISAVAERQLAMVVGVAPKNTDSTITMPGVENEGLKVASLKPDINRLPKTEIETTYDRTTYVLSTGLFILLLLTILNYVLDYLHRKEYQSLVTRT